MWWIRYLYVNINSSTMFTFQIQFISCYICNTRLIMRDAILPDSVIGDGEITRKSQIIYDCAQNLLPWQKRFCWLLPSSACRYLNGCFPFYLFPSFSFLKNQKYIFDIDPRWGKINVSKKFTIIQVNPSYLTSISRYYSSLTQQVNLYKQLCDVICSTGL